MLKLDNTGAWVIEVFIITLCSNELRLLNPYRGCSIRAIPARFDVIRCALLCRRYTKTEVGRADGFNRQFSLIFAYFHVNSVDKSYRKAIINYLRESNTKMLTSKRQVIFCIYLIM